MEAGSAQTQRPFPCKHSHQISEVSLSLLQQRIEMPFISSAWASPWKVGGFVGTKLFPFQKVKRKIPPK